MSDFPAFRTVPRTGVIFVTAEATKLGFTPRDPDWCNLGQGQPETGELPGSPKRVQQIEIDVDDQEYAPVAGLWELREQIAGFYNRTYRQGMKSQYSAENVSLSGGGRASLTRAAAAWATSTWATFFPTTPRTKSCWTSSRRSPRFRFCSKVTAATRSARTT